jgi:hypothetical protein
VSEPSALEQATLHYIHPNNVVLLGGYTVGTNDLPRNVESSIYNIHSRYQLIASFTTSLRPISQYLDNFLSFKLPRSWRTNEHIRCIESNVTQNIFFQTLPTKLFKLGSRRRNRQTPLKRPHRYPSNFSSCSSFAFHNDRVYKHCWHEL